MLKIFTARENIDTKKFMYERIAAAMTERRVFLIVPEQSTLRAEADAFDYMGVPGFIDFDVLSMTSLGRRIIEEVGYKAAGAASSAAARDHSGPVCDGEQVLPGDQEGGAAGPPGFISKYGKYMLLSRLLYRHKSEMRTFKHLEASPDFVEQLNNMIAELKNHNVTPENLREIIEEMKSESILKHKLEDATLIYGGYEDAIAGRYLDTTDHLKLYTSKMGEATFIPGAEFWLHGFDYLSPAVMDAVTELARHADSVNLVLTGDIGGIEDVDTRELNTTGPQKLKSANTQELNTAGALSSKDKFEDKRILAHRPDFRKTGNDPLFLLTNSLATALVRQAGDAGIQASADAIPSDAASGYLQELPPEIAHIERTLFTRPHTPYIEEVGLSNSGGEVGSHEAEQRVILQNGQSGRDVVLDSKRNLANDGAVSLTGNGAIFPTDDRAVLPAENAAVPTLRLIAAANYYAEAETAAAEVCALVRDGIDISGGARSGIRYRDILVLCNDMAERGPIIKQVFQRYGLPVFMDRRRSVEHNPVVEFILALPRITASGRRYEEVFTLLKTGLTDMDSDEVCELENYVIRFNIRGRRWDRDFTLGLKREEADGRVKGDYTQEELDALNASRQKVATLISAFEKRFKGGRAAKERTGALFAFLTEQAKLPEMIDHYKTTLEDAGMLEYAAEMAGMWDVVTEILDQMGTVLGDLPMSMDEYATVLRTGLDAIRIGVLPTVMDQVVLGTMQRTRSGGAKAVFVLGANDGVLPASPQSGAILSEDEIYRLADAGHNVARTEDTTHMEEELAIYRNLSKPRVLLRVSYAASDSAGKTIGPSPVFERLRRLFPETPVEKDMRNAAIHALPEQLPTGLCNDIAVP
ncbi:MAG: exodeoxyribonuclease V subunit gamma, partial [Clostridiales Family XIII bacterium]|nr:exodeoxyribonuclease V subunit gamma [Clostridiales Family XIII bacterium]